MWLEPTFQENQTNATPGWSENVLDVQVRLQRNVSGPPLPALAMLQATLDWCKSWSGFVHSWKNEHKWKWLGHLESVQGTKQKLQDIKERNPVSCFTKLRPPCLQQDTNTQTHTQVSSALHLSWILILILLLFFQKELHIYWQSLNPRLSEILFILL